jgi:hypothetical protein
MKNPRKSHLREQQVRASSIYQILPRGRSSARLIFLPEEAASTCTARDAGTFHYAVRLSEQVPGTARWISPANGRELEWDEIVTS